MDLRPHRAAPWRAWLRPVRVRWTPDRPLRASPRWFALTLLAAFVLTLAALAAAQYVVGAKGLERALVQRRLVLTHADAESMRHAVAGHGREDQWNALHEVLHVIAGRPGVESVVVADRHGAVVAAESVRGPTLAPGQPGGLALAARRGASSARRWREGEDALFLYTVPLPLGGRDLALQVREDDTVLDQEVGGLRRGVLWVLLGGLLLGAPLFYLLGGRWLIRAQRLEADRSTRDALTGLGNHRAFQEELRRAAPTARRHGHRLALLLCDVDDFKSVNDLGGHRHGDAVLETVGRLLRTGRPEDRAFRVGGDEFALILLYSDLAAARTVAERLRAAVREARPGVTLSVGVAGLGRGALDSTELWARADAALREAKRRGRDLVVTFDDIAGETTIVTASQTAALRRIIDERRVKPVFQPIWDLRRDAVLGFEALARPQPPSGSPELASPLAAFEVAERIGRSGDLDAVCRQAMLDGAGELPDGALLFVNVSPHSLGHGSLCGEQLVREVRAAGLTPRRVVLEITERDIVAPGSVAAETARLRAFGFAVALDDAGAGNAGLEMLRHVHVDYVKIDREIIAGAGTEPLSRAVMLAIVAFAHETGAYVIAEGIESPGELALVRGIGRLPTGRAPLIHGVQGYLLGRPTECCVAGQPPGRVAAPRPDDELRSAVRP